MGMERDKKRKLLQAWLCVLLVVNLSTSAVILLLSAGYFGYAREFYLAPFPLIAQAAAAGLFAIAGLFANRYRFPCLVVSSVAVSLLLVPKYYAEVQFRSGSGDAGLFWAVLCFFAGWLTAAIGPATLIIGVVLRMLSRRLNRSQQ
ncbi:MAG TPA: hypothetical protein PLP01_00435 [Phycisphaerae bacterium]|nr:hypothetical protein [Phycisphaerae bacterium]